MFLCCGFLVDFNACFEAFIDSHKSIAFQIHRDFDWRTETERGSEFLGVGPHKPIEYGKRMKGTSPVVIERRLVGKY